MMNHWEFALVLGFIVLVLLWTLGELCWAAYKRERRWRKIAPHYGSVYDATSKPRANVRLVRTR